MSAGTGAAAIGTWWAPSAGISTTACAGLRVSLFSLVLTAAIGVGVGVCGTKTEKKKRDDDLKPKDRFFRKVGHVVYGTVVYCTVPGSTQISARPRGRGKSAVIVGVGYILYSSATVGAYTVVYILYCTVQYINIQYRL